MFNHLLKIITNAQGRLFNTQEVKNCIVGTLNYRKSNFTVNSPKLFFSDNGPWKMKSKRTAKNIVIVLESPHYNEYSEDGMPLRPAMGDTGTQLKKNIVEKINKNTKEKKLKRGNYNLWLVNAVPYQCSLGIRPIQTELRNVIYRFLWKELEEDF